jgi:hypothetical protein
MVKLIPLALGLATIFLGVGVGSALTRKYVLKTA